MRHNIRVNDPRWIRTTDVKCATGTQVYAIAREAAKVFGLDGQSNYSLGLGDTAYAQTAYVTDLPPGETFDLIDVGGEV